VQLPPNRCLTAWVIMQKLLQASLPSPHSAKPLKINLTVWTLRWLLRLPWLFLTLDSHGSLSSQDLNHNVSTTPAGLLPYSRGCITPWSTPRCESPPSKPLTAVPDCILWDRTPAPVSSLLSRNPPTQPCSKLNLRSPSLARAPATGLNKCNEI
jgi:hypothetical protein